MLRMRLPALTSPASILLAFVIPMSACRHRLVNPPLADFSGVYRISDARQGMFCSPQPLPAPLSTDTTLYAQIPSHRFSVSSLLQIVQAGDDLSIVPLDPMGHPTVALMMSGTIDPAARAGSLFRAALPRTEGPRVGGYTFYVSDASAATVRLNLLMSTPGGAGGTSAVSAEAAVLIFLSDTIAFLDGGARGTLFTTCVVSDTLAGTRGGS